MLFRSGSVATPYEYINFQTQLSMCQRYYAKSYAQGIVPGTAYTAATAGIFFAYTSGANVAVPGFLPVTLRATPTLTIYDAAGNAGKVSYYSSGWNNNGTLLGSFCDGQQLSAQLSGTSTSLNYQYTVSAEIP